MQRSVLLTTLVLLASCGRNWLLEAGEAGTVPRDQDGTVQWVWEEATVREGKTSKLATAPSRRDSWITEGEGLAGPPVECIAQMADGSMAFGTEYGLTILRKETLETHVFPSLLAGKGKAPLPGLAAPGVAVQDLLATPDGTLWAATSGGVYRLKDGAWQRLKPASALSLRTSWLADAQKLFYSSHGKVVIGSRCAGITVVDPKTQSITTIYSRGGENNWVTGIAEDKDGVLWVGIFGLGVVRYDDERFELLTSREEWLPSPSVRALVIDGAGHIWVGTDKGLGMRSPDGQSKVLTGGSGLLDDAVWRLFVARNRSLWVGSDDGFAVRRRGRWRYPVLARGSWHPASDPFEAKDGSRWVGCMKGVVRNPTLKFLRSKPIANSVNRLKARVESKYSDVATGENVVRDGRQRVWIGMRDRLLCFDGKAWTDRSQELGGASISCLMSDSKGRVWIGTIGAGLIGYEGDKLVRYNDDRGHGRSYVYDVAESSNGVLFVGTQYGLYELVAARWRCVYEPTQAIKLQLDKKGRLWFIDVNYGLFLYDGGKVTRVSLLKELTSRKVTQLTPTALGSMRVTTSTRTTAGVETVVFDCDGTQCTRVDEGPGKTVDK